MRIETSMSLIILFLSFVVKVPISLGVTLDSINCGIDNNAAVAVGNVPVSEYPWVGVLYYANNDQTGESRAVTTVILIHQEFVLTSAADVGPMPKHDFRVNTRVLLGEEWRGAGRRVRNYVLHPEYGETLSTLALVQLRDVVRDSGIHPACPPPDLLRDPEFYVIKFDETDYNNLQKQVVPVTHVPGKMCKDFYVAANLYVKKMRPPHVTCAVALDESDEGGANRVCVWEAGAALAARDLWGRWQLLGLGVRGPGCGAPARFLDIMSYLPWITSSLQKFQRLTITKLSKQNYVLRSGATESTYMRYGACDPEEKINLIYRERIHLRTNNNQFQFLTYNMTILDNVEYSCLTMQLVNASAVSEMRIQHYCTRYSYGPICYSYRGSVFAISVYLMFSDTCTFEMFAWGFPKNMTLLDPQEWKWEEGTYYEDFTMKRVEYRGPTDETLFGFEPIDDRMWVPEYDLWTTTQFDESIWSSTTPPPDKGDGEESGVDKKQGAATEGVLVEPGTVGPESEFLIGIRW
ncbi:hypothetical protein ACJJTC_004216 [Scirpophaga incertulas]